MIRCILAFALILGIWGSVVGKATGQELPRRYQPSRPTISPYLNLFRPNFGAIPNYYAFVRPQLDQQAINLQQGQAINSNTQSIARVADKAKQPLAPQGVPTGTASQFMTLSHFYPPHSTAPPRAKAR